MSKPTFIPIALLSVTLMMSAGCTKKTASDHITEAQQLIEQGDNTAAIIALKNAIQLDPRNAQPRFELGKLYMTLQDYESAEKELSRALDFGYKPAEVLPLLSKAYQQTRADLAMSELPLDSSGLTNTDKLIVGYRKAISLIALEENKQAVLLSENLTALNVNSVYHDLIQLVPLLVNQHYDAAIAQAEKAKARSPLNSDVLLILARLYTFTGKQEQAIGTFTDYLRVEPGDIRVKFILASLLIQQRKAELAEPYIDELLTINSKSAYLNQLKSIARAVDQDHSSALKYAELAINTGRLDPTLRVVAGFAAYKIGEYDKAVEHLASIASLLPNDHKILRLLAASQVNSSTSAEVKSVIARLDSFSATDIPLLSKAAVEMLKADDEATASALVDEVEALSESAEQIVQLNMLKLSIDDIDGLIDMSQFTDEQPAPVEAQEIIAKALIQHGKYSEAKVIADELINTEDGRFHGLLLKAELALAEQDLATADSFIQEALKEQPGARDARLLLMTLLAERGETDAAVKEARQIVSSAPNSYKAWHLLLSQPVDTTQDDLTQLIKILGNNATDAPLRMLAAQKALQADRQADALTLIKSVELTAQSPQLLWQLKGNVLVGTNQVTSALAHFKLWSSLYPNQENAALGVIAVNNIRGNYPAALAEANRFLALEDNQDIRLLQALFNVKIGNIKEAKAALEKMDRRLLSEPAVRGVQARIALMEKRPDEALNDALPAYEANRNFDNVALVASIYSALKQQAEALKILESHNATKSKDIRSLMLMAEYQLVLNPEAAVLSYQEAIEQDAGNYVALNNLAYLKMNAGALDDAKALIEKAYKIAPTNAGVVDSYAEILVKLDNDKEAIVLYETIIEQPQLAEHIKLNYIEILLREGNKAIAQRKLERMRFTLPASFIRLNQLVKEYDLANITAR